MSANVLINNSEKYQGLYVTTSSFQSKDVLTASSDPAKAYNAAKEQGCEDPVLLFVPDNNMTYIY
ncbi:MAG: hypothetical protein NTX06_04035 [Proteobacteria bacterium]|jgi:hypothetical protein|nr:hypothetical protein [Pseudomonadota bacterium]